MEKITVKEKSEYYKKVMKYDKWSRTKEIAPRTKGTGTRARRKANGASAERTYGARTKRTWARTHGTSESWWCAKGEPGSDPRCGSNGECRNRTGIQGYHR